MEQSHDDVQLHLVRRSIGRHPIVVALFTILIGSAAAAYAYTMPTEYTASATILPNPSPGNPLTPDSSASSGAQLTVAMQTEAGLVDTPAVAKLASESLDEAVPQESDRIGVTVPDNTQIIEISYTASTAEVARARAQAFAEAYLEYRKNQAEHEKEQSLSTLKKQAKAASDGLAEATRESDSETASGSRDLATQQVQLYADRLATLNDSISTAKSLRTNPGSVVTAASLPSSTDGLNPTLIVLAGSLLGVAAGLLLALWMEWRKDVVRPSTELEVLGTPVYAHIPRQPARSAPLISGRASDDDVHEAYRRLRAGVTASAQPPQLISVTCVSPNQSSSTIAANLGLSLSHAGYRVMFVAADPQDPKVDDLFGIGRGPGLTDLMTRRSDLADCVSRVDGIQVMPCGTDAETAPELFAGPRLAVAMSELRSRYDYVILAAADTTTAIGDAIASVTDCVLVVLSDEHTTHAETELALNRFRQLDVAVVGAIAAPHARSETRDTTHQPSPPDRENLASGEDLPGEDLPGEDLPREGKRRFIVTEAKVDGSAAADVHTTA